MADIATYEEVKDLVNHPEKVLIDVREPKQRQETGEIPTSINIPIGELETALKLPATEFEAKYGRTLTNGFDTPLLFHCGMGGRAQKGTDLAKSLGFTNTKNYKGSWKDWSEKEGIHKKE